MVEASDVLIEVLDARDPLGCRCLDVERFVRKLDPSKKIVLLLNKIGAHPRLLCLAVAAAPAAPAMAVVVAALACSCCAGAPRWSRLGRGHSPVAAAAAMLAAGWEVWPEARTG